MPLYTLNIFVLKTSPSSGAKLPHLIEPNGLAVFGKLKSIYTFKLVYQNTSFTSFLRSRATAPTKTKSWSLIID